MSSVKQYITNTVAYVRYGSSTYLWLLYGTDTYSELSYSPLISLAYTTNSTNINRFTNKVELSY
jgi:hypothetical protein